MDKRVETPLIDALEDYRVSGKVKMHMPGHKGGQGFPQSFYENLVQYDFTEIFGLDNLHNPESVIKSSLDKCAKAFGARRSFYLVNGSTSGIHAMLISVMKKGDKLLVQRDCHQSVINGLILFGIHPVFVMPGYDATWHVKTPAGIEAWEKALSDNPDAKGAIVTSPDYFGICAPLNDLADLLHTKGKILLVDEAHGAHFVCSPKLPTTALEQGADLCVQSFHKTMPSLTQAAVLHIGSTRVSESRIKLAASMLTTTSPSYPIMASMEYATEFVTMEGSAKYDELIGMLDKIKNDLGRMKKLKLLPDEKQGLKRDPTRIVIYTYNSDLSGFELYKRLDKDYGIVAEMADESHIVFIITAADKNEDLLYLKDSLIELDENIELDEKSKTKNIHKNAFSILPKPLQPEEFFIPELSTYLDEHHDVPLNCAEGYKNAGMITPYPPGIPFLFPGETITKEHIHALCNMVMQNGEVHGLIFPEDGAETRIRVFIE